MAKLAADEFHVAAVLMACEVPSLKFATAFICSIEPGTSTAVVGLTEIDVTVAELTFRGAAPVTPPKLALIEADPCPTAVATPAVPAALLTVATPPALLAQVTSCVIFCVLVSLNTPTAVKVRLVRGAMERLEGATEMVAMVALVTSRVALPLSELSVAVIVVIPRLRPVARPEAGVIVATAVCDELHATWSVISRVPPSL